MWLILMKWPSAVAVAAVLNLMLGVTESNQSGAVESLVWRWLEVFLKKRYDWDLSSFNYKDLRKFAILRGLCHKVGRELVPRDFDMNSPHPFQKVDIVSLVPVHKKKTKVASQPKKPSAAVIKKKEDSSDSSDDSDSDSDEEENAKVTSQPKKVPATATKKDDSDESSDEDEDEESSDEEEKQPSKTPKKTARINLSNSPTGDLI